VAVFLLFCVVKGRVSRADGGPGGRRRRWSGDSL